MESFRVIRVGLVDLGPVSYEDAVELTCRSCIPDLGVRAETGAMLVCTPPKVGRQLTCPGCGELSVVPKKARWS